MKQTILGFFIVALAVSAGLAAPAPGDKTIQFSLGGNLTMLSATHENDSFFLVGAALRVDFNLGRSFSVAPEASAGIGGWTAGGTVNFRSRKFFAGAGYLAAGLGGSGQSWGVVSLLKVHAGTKGPRWLIAGSFVTNSWFKGFGLTAGYMF
jgi:hypothetical protein